MAAFRSPRRSEKALSSSWCSRSSVRRSAIWRSRAARSRSRLRGAGQLLRLGAQLAGSLARPAALVPQGVSLGLGRRHRRGRVGQLLQPLAKEPAVVHDGLQLPVEDTEHRTVLGTERPTTGRALALGPEQLDFVPLLLQIVVLAQQLGPAGRRVFLLPHPHRALLFRGALRRLEPLRQRQHLALRRGERRSGGPERVDAAVHGGHRAAQLLELPLVGAPRRTSSSRAAAAVRSASSRALSGRPASSPRSSLASALRRSRTRSWASRSRSYPSTRDRNAARSVLPRLAITASSFCPVK